MLVALDAPMRLRLPTSAHAVPAPRPEGKVRKLMLLPLLIRWQSGILDPSRKSLACFLFVFQLPSPLDMFPPLAASSRVALRCLCFNGTYGCRMRLERRITLSYTCRLKTCSRFSMNSTSRWYVPLLITSGIRLLEAMFSM